MQFYCESLTQYRRLKTREVRVGDLLLGNGHPVRVQTMTTTDTMDTAATVAQTIRCIEAGAELVRITAPSKKEAENLLLIRQELNRQGYSVPLVADIHFTPNAAEIAARIVEKVRVNPGNYVDKKKFELIDYTDADYAEEIERIRDRFTPLVRICKEYGTAMRIGTNHGSLSDRIMSRYGDTPIGMVESAMEFLRIARGESYHNIVLSMKSSNPQVMVQAYRLLVRHMQDEFGECYPLHLGVTEAGDGEDGRIKSAVGIGTLLEDGLGDTIRVSLTEDPELEIPVCRDLVKRYAGRNGANGVNGSGVNGSMGQSVNGKAMGVAVNAVSMETTTNHQPPTNNQQSSIVNRQSSIPEISRLPYDPFHYKRRTSFALQNIGGGQVPVVIADLSLLEAIRPADLEAVGYRYDAATDKWTIADTAADYLFTGNAVLSFALPGTLKVIVYPAAWQSGLAEATVAGEETARLFTEKYYPIFEDSGYVASPWKHPVLNFVMVDCFSDDTPLNDFTHLETLAADEAVVLCLGSRHPQAMPAVRRMFMELELRAMRHPVVIMVDSNGATADEHLIHFATEAGALLLDGFGDGVCFGVNESMGEWVNGREMGVAVNAVSTETTTNHQLQTTNEQSSIVNRQS
ncbi:MAG TPA: (E)-4-hydroxy-3-methylbut-2-enyl-diphosphate synthase, partial [Chitinophagaceae bacterium]|nr:(E)-4-hydroxy-3-methylbut-2-enyl-diphosphate synthase [Chitinophagaceae bacterium]